MPLLFAIAGIVALGLSFVILVGPVLLMVGVIRSIRSARLQRMAAPHLANREGSESAVDCHITNEAFADLVGREWPNEATALRGRLQ